MITYSYLKSTEINIEIKTYDIDVAGHVNNMVYIRWLEDMRNELFSKICPLEKLLTINYYPVVVSSEIRYKKQIKLFDKPVGKMLLQSYSHGVFVFKAEISIDDHVAFISTQKSVLMNLNDNKMFKGHIHELVKQH